MSKQLNKLTLRIKNFQSIADSEIECEGFTALIGSTNTGKSAVRRAFEALFNNAKSTRFVRNGCKEAVVEITYNGHTIQWRKSRDNTVYVVDNQPFDKAGKETPEEINIMGITPICTNDQRLWPQVSSQSRPIFLLDSGTSPSVVAGALSAVSYADKVAEASRAAGLDLSRARNSLNETTGTLAQLQERARFFSGIEEIVPVRQQLQNVMIQLQKIQRTIASLSTLKDRYSRIISQLVYTQTLSLLSAPKVDLTPYEKIVTLKELFTTITKLRSVNVDAIDIKSIKTPNLSDSTQQLLQKTQRLQMVGSRYRLLRPVDAILPTVPAYDFSNLGNKLKRLYNLNTTVKNFTAQGDCGLASLQHDYTISEKTFRDSLTQLGTCPLCGATTK